jgi:pSer/pThr/pTyr-binding forkhead associated (FHA) protein
MEQTRITITEPNGVQRTVPLTSRGVTIGRGSDNSLVINYPDVSRYHAQIATDGVTTYVTDLDSGNGTFLDNQPLVPNVSVIWQPGMLLQVGSAKIQLTQGFQQPEYVQPQQPRTKERQDTETFVGWAPPKDAGQKRNWSLIGGVIAVTVLCACAMIGTAVYFAMQPAG